MQEHNLSANNFEQCMKCNICTSVCPVVKVLPVYKGPKREGPDAERLRLKNSLFFSSNLEFCLNCKRCETVCPSGVKVSDIIHSARAKYYRKKPKLRDRMLASTDMMGSLAVPFSGIVNPLLGTGAAKSVLDGVMGIDRRREFPSYTSGTFERWFRKHAAPAQEAFNRKVCYFHGCYVNYNYPELGRDFVRVINALGYGVELLDDERCCGVAMISSGMFDQAARNARHNIKAIQAPAAAGKPVLTTSTTCILTMRDEYKDVLGIDNSSIRDAISLGLRFIFEIIDSGKAKIVWKEGFKARTAYHVPCHMEKLGWSILTRELMGMIPGMDMTVLDSNCCGMAGTYGFKKERYEISQEIGAPLFRQIDEVAPDYVICECETCKWQIEMSTAFKVKNPITVLAEAMDIQKTMELNATSSL